MTAIVYRFVRPSSRASNLGVSDFAVVTCFSLVGLVLSLAFVHFGFDLGTGIPG
jgi:hypothetical protein